MSSSIVFALVLVAQTTLGAEVARKEDPLITVQVETAEPSPAGELLRLSVPLGAITLRQVVLQRKLAPTPGAPTSAAVPEATAEIEIPPRSYAVGDLLLLRLSAPGRAGAAVPAGDGPSGTEAPGKDGPGPSSPGPASSSPGAVSSTPRAILFLRSGGELAGEVGSGDEKVVRWRSPSLGAEPLPVSLDAVRGLLVTGPAGAAGSGPFGTREGAVRDQALAFRLRGEILSGRARRDQIVLLEGGRIEGILEALEADGIRFNSEGLGDVRLAYGKVRALLLADLEAGDGAGSSERSGSTGGAGTPGGAGGGGASGRSGGAASLSPAGAEPAVRLRLVDGGDLPCALLELGAGQISVMHQSLGKLRIGLDQVEEIAFLGGRATFLSDMEPVSVKEESGLLFRLKMPFRRDASVLGTPMRMNGRTYRKGLGVHSYSLLEYNLDGRFARFTATLGLDETARPDSSVAAADSVGSVVFRVRLDGKVLLEKAMSWRDDPVRADVAVAGGKRLSLEVDYGGTGGEFNLALDRADWADARLIR